MNQTYFRGLSMEHIKSSAENGYLRGSDIDEEEVFTEMGVEMDVYEKDSAVWMTDSEECAKVYGGGGGYFEIDPSELKVVEDRDSCYAVVMREELSLDHVDAIHIEQKDGDRDHLLEIANALGEEHGDIVLDVYEPEELEVA